MYLFREIVMNQTEEAILISWRLQQWFEGMVLDARAMQDVQDAIEMLKTLAKQVQKWTFTLILKPSQHKTQQLLN